MEATTRQCSLSVVALEAEPCPTVGCAFWQEGGDDLEPGCAVERLELDLHEADVAGFLLGIRRRLEATP
jgi:hypothetical protein